MFCLPGSELVGGDCLGEAASGTFVGNEDRLVHAEDLGGLGHEVDAAKHDLRCFDFGGHTTQAERIAGVMRDVLNLGQLIVVRQNDGVFFLGELQHLLTPVGGKQFHIRCGVGHEAQRRPPDRPRDQFTGSKGVGIAGRASPRLAAPCCPLVPGRLRS
jgi:hypothetical protein